MTITIRGQEFEADFYDVEFMDRYEDATAKMKNSTNADYLNEPERTGDKMRRLIGTVNAYFNEVFGPGAAEKIFTGSAVNNVREHLLAVDELIGAADAQGKDLNDAVNRHTQRIGARAKPHLPQSGAPIPMKHGKKRRR